MTDVSKLEQKIDSQNSKIDTLVETMTTFVSFQARAEERHSYTKETLDKLVERVDTLWDMVHRNALIVNGAVAIVTAVSIWIIKGYIGG